MPMSENGLALNNYWKNKIKSGMKKILTKRISKVTLVKFYYVFSK